MRKKLKLWLKINSLKDVVEIAEEMQKWSKYLAHSAKQGDVKEVTECLENLQELFNKARGQ
jgi:hypothetical protein|tara:strand:+ start:152 stop:334 length:183 start_codon:yes stop_codon:yes gene_type:complete